MTTRDWTKEISEEELDQQIEQAKLVGDNCLKCTFAQYNTETKSLDIRLDNGVEISIPIKLIQGLSEANDDQLSQLHISGSKDSLHWESLNVDLSIEVLVAGSFGSKLWMSELGKLGGKAQSESKSQAARENGKKGGRPRK